MTEAHYHQSAIEKDEYERAYLSGVVRQIDTLAGYTNLTADSVRTAFYEWWHGTVLLEAKLGTWPWQEVLDWLIAECATLELQRRGIPHVHESEIRSDYLQVIGLTSETALNPSLRPSLWKRMRYAFYTEPSKS